MIKPGLSTFPVMKNAQGSLKLNCNHRRAVGGS
jgi:hypothetical protein